ncbi:MFS transporter [Actinoallomurus purpureus]|uniref:MFS transporter n=1 Tax=Actinoallomurus purpureus TaxID=478114 RepID=UPI002092DE7D|nr:MFS transporter [Actinoallomurus purpureus]MCO6010709.1 MFS transporter [Actinoallomurus purpureus]
MSQQTVQMGDPPLADERRRRHMRHPGLSLAVIVACQLMVVLDASVMFVALPKIQHSLHFSATGLSWVTNAYSLAFGGLLLLGGRTGDMAGRRRTFIIGIAVFTLASLFGGFSGSAAWLLTARVVQGVGAALAAPSALALIATNFEEGPERNRALGVFSATSSAGASIGLVLGGMLTDWASWRWVLFINVPVGAVVLFLAPRVLRETERHRGRLDVAGAVTVVTGMVALVYGFIRAADAGWGDGGTLAAFAGGVLLLAAFLVVEMRAERPVVPLRLFADRARSGSYLNMLLLAAAMFGMFFFIVQFLQNVLGFSPLKAGVAFLPMSGLIFVMARVSPRLIPRVGARRLILIGLPLIAVGMAWLTRLSAHSGYASGVLAPMVLFGLGAGLVFLPVTATVLAGVRREDSGAASGTLQTAQQVGGALGMAVLVSVYGTALRHGGLTHGVNVAFTVGTIFVLVALAVTAAFVRPRTS